MSVMSARRFWDVHIRQVEKSATRVFGRTDEGSHVCTPITLAEYNNMKYKWRVEYLAPGATQYQTLGTFDNIEDASKCKEYNKHLIGTINIYSTVIRD